MNETVYCENCGDAPVMDPSPWAPYDYQERYCLDCNDGTPE